MKERKDRRREQKTLHEVAEMRDKPRAENTV
jgi:hypothetical protein